MKNKIMVTLLAAAVMCFGLAACSDGGSSDSVKDSGSVIESPSESVSGSESTSDTSTGGDSEESTHTYEISGAKDIVLKRGNANYNYLDGISGKEDGKDAEVIADTEKIDVSEAGVYELTYKLGTKTEKVDVYVID